MKKKCDVLILGAGVIGLASGIALLQERPNFKVIIAEKESGTSFHASGRNSGVLHAGFYYSPDSLKARFCRDGNIELRNLAKKHNVFVRDVGKVVVTQNSDELVRLESLFERGITNGVDIEILDEKVLKNFEPLALTCEKFLWSPTTGVSDPKAITNAMREEFISLGGQIDFNTRIQLTIKNNEVYDSTHIYDAKHIINAAGAQADRISKSVGIGLEYAMVPFMGIYRATNEKNLPLQRLVYPVPHLINPFLGVHFTLTVDHKVKIGPTAIPIAGREQYSIFKGWSPSDLAQSFKGTLSLISGEAHQFGPLLKSEWPKILQSKLIQSSSGMVPEVLKVKDWQRKPPGIRAQLVHLPTGKLEQDFIVQSQANSTHILNAVSPGWTSSLPFARWLVNEVVIKKMT